MIHLWLIVCGYCLKCKLVSNQWFIVIITYNYYRYLTLGTQKGELVFYSLKDSVIKYRVSCTSGPVTSLCWINELRCLYNELIKWKSLYYHIGVLPWHQLMGVFILLILALIRHHTTLLFLNIVGLLVMWQSCDLCILQSLHRKVKGTDFVMLPYLKVIYNNNNIILYLSIFSP